VVVGPIETGATEVVVVELVDVEVLLGVEVVVVGVTAVDVTEVGAADPVAVVSESDADRSEPDSICVVQPAASRPRAIIGHITSRRR
jgi:hypothetical protein